MKNIYIGVDVGSVSVNVVAIDEEDDLLFKSYTRNIGQPVDIVKSEIKKLYQAIGDSNINGIGITGSGRQLLGYILGADVVKNEITAHATATLYYYPDVKTIFEIGGQDSKLIIINDGIISDFAMNTVCAAGTGSFLDHQAERLGIKIEDFGEIALTAERDVRIAGRCTVFAESDMISKQQYGFSKAEILKGLSKALVRNYMNNLVRGKKLKPLYVFQGGVAANVAIKKAFEEEIGEEVIVPKHFDVMGAIGIAMIAKNHIKTTNKPTKFKGFEISEEKFVTTSFICNGCPNECEVIKIQANGKTIAMTGDKCGKWSNSIV
ncbi:MULTISPECIES: acyl-CoA dehydratase activase [Thermoanaerobacterium]|uniref:CoA-substrate-specific enzyme activase n=1 Tax=Thermoanaerobacterium xylanolyticum (strain ATCC 49914 / DSM 7097 / LX-11) TaxID=858215 RepID=F6BH80_THEXL|nr:acyl-CoA dehydratase activase [Thermoanaerobacterium xylanolyticum]AEF16524.1 CoA-substrate-specific enzyme activase [Thermoanaerobacterium xylanolyticum LX-11]